MFKERIAQLLLFFVVINSYAARAQSPGWLSLATAQIKLDTNKATNISIADINNDRYPDLVTIKYIFSPVGTPYVTNNINVYMNIQDPASSDPHARVFVDVTGTSGANSMLTPDSPGRGTTMVALADVNNDGNVDLVRGNYYHSTVVGWPDFGDRCEVLLGDGMGHFHVVANNGLHDLGMINPSGFSFLDYDKDGKLDLFIAVWFADYSVQPEVLRAGYLMHGNGDGTFTNASAAAGITKKEPMYGCSVVDWNNDGWPDIATAPYCRTGGQLWKNKGDGTFQDVAASAGYNARYKQGDNGQNLCMWSAVPEDFDNDGDMDFFFLLVHGGNDANEGHSTIVLNGGAATNYHLDWALNRVTKDAPSSSHNGDYDASWFDLDNDGLEDIVMAQGHYVPPTDRLYIFRQSQANTFSDITQETDLLGTSMRDIHAVEVMDYDLDGDDDVLFCHNVIDSIHFLKNDIGQDNNWTAIRLIAPAGVNKNAIGARIYVWAGGVQHMREVYAGRGNFSGQQPLALIFGLGSNTTIDSIKVQWPNATGTSTTVTNIPANHYISIGQNGLDVPEVSREATTLKVYPNPARDYILVQLSDNNKDVTIEIYNMMGQQMQNVVVPDNAMATKYCSVQQLPVGSYVVKVTTKNGTILSQPFTKIN